MFKIEELIDLFEEDKVKELLLYAYMESQKSNKQLSDSVFTSLYNLKLFNNIEVNIDYTLPNSFYSSERDSIYLNTLSTGTFFHELTHMLSHHYSHKIIPNEFNSLKERLSNDNNKKSFITYFMEICSSRLNNLFSSSRIDIEKNNLTVGDFNDEISTQINIIGMIEDIVDALYDGESFETGIRYIKDANYISKKSNQSGGHGCDYYNDSSHQFEEILANYQAINMLDPNNELFTILKQEILGNEFTSFLDQRCREIEVVIEINKQHEDKSNKI